MTETEFDLSKSDKTREEVLYAAARRFRHDGYYATTIRDVAKEAGSIYYHFASKKVSVL